MSERKRLIDIIQKSVDGCANYWAGLIADGLLKNGIIIPLCKIGDKVYNYDNNGRIYENKVEWFYYDKDYKRIVYDCDTSFAFDVSAIGKSVFLTCEEIETVLKNK